MSSLCDVKKSVSVPESFSDSNNKKISDNIYYEEAWDLRMARLGIDIAKLNSIFSDSILSNSDDIECGTMTRSCIGRVERQDPPIIRMTSSAIESTVMANNPVYSFKSYENTLSCVAASSALNNPLQFMESNDLSRQYRADSEQTLNDHSGSTMTMRPKPNHGILLNNNCYELAPSQLVNAIIDRDRECPTTRLLSSAAPSAFKPLFTSKSRLGQQTTICNNHCYTCVPVSMASGSQNITAGYCRQISAPVDSATEMLKKMAYPEDLERTSKTLQLKTSRRSLKKTTQDSSISSQPANAWTLKNRFQVDEHLRESSRISSKLMSKSVGPGDSRLSDNYIKHLTGQEIAGNFIKQSQRPECHIQRTEDRYHMGFNDSRLDMIADSNRPLEEHLWYHPFISRVTAEQLLAKYPEGSFLVRRSESSSNEYSLSIRYKQKWLHMKISRDADGQFVLGQYSQPYPSVPIMIRHYSCSFLPVKGANLISLQQPVFRH